MTDNLQDPLGQPLAGSNPPKKDDSSKLKQMGEDIRHEVQNRKTPIYIAFMAAFLALASMADGEEDKAALTAQIDASNNYAYFQAKNIRGTSAEIAAENFRAAGNAALATKWQDISDRYDKEKQDILKEAKGNQADRAIAIKRGDYYGIAVALLQIAIVLASISLITGGGVLLGLSFTLTLIAAFFTANGYGLYYDIPSDPEGMIKAIGIKYQELTF